MSVYYKFPNYVQVPRANLCNVDVMHMDEIIAYSVSYRNFGQGGSSHKVSVA